MMEIKCAWCGEDVGSQCYHSTVHNIRLQGTEIEVEQYDEAWICVDCFNRIEEVLGDLHDDIQQV